MYKLNSQIKDKFTSLVVKEIFGYLQKILNKTELAKMEIVYPPNKEMGDFSLPCFSLAKNKKKNPVVIAQGLAQEIKLKKNSLIKDIKPQGPYLNFFTQPHKKTEIIFNDIFSKKKSPERKKKVMVEYVSPNTNKPLHLGHGRNAFLGWALSNILKENNYQVIKVCLINDRGIHIIKSMLAYEKLGQKATPRKQGIKGDHFVGEYYAKFTELEKQNFQIESESHTLLQKWESGDKKTIALWKKMNSWVMSGLKETWKNIGISFDKFYFESAIYKKGRNIILRGLKEKKFQKKDGAVMVNLKKYNLSDKVLLRSDGTSLYITQDIYLSYLKYKDFHPQKIIHIIGNEQDLAQKQLFAILDILNFRVAKNLYHLSYGMVNVEGGKLKSRDGVKVDLDTLIKTLKDLAGGEIKKRQKNLTKKEITERSRVVALGALKYYILQYGPKTTVNFDPQKSLAFTGRTGVYLQYSYARAKNIIKKSGKKITRKIDFTQLNKKEEIELISLLGKFKETIKNSGEKYDPSILAKYLYELAKSFHIFYHSSSVLKTDKETQKARLFLVYSFAEIIKKGLAILGIDVLEEI